ncbi:hypothetical protein [Streptomyces lavendofoliae]|uniref:Uncharacterized protein n=1 Tax=Streptomyces lavendofoliae TaxID=67314 RepID=A0A918I2K3_9ACTN|nr:hypothetical protein [Streptomyces lavendofoliae]GGU52393.1 hypothetical protein GCM10010274_46640 [Streptomyces lavendofoliae]
MSQTTVITDIVNAEVDKLKREYARKEFQGVHSGSVRFGLFGNLVGAEVSAEQRIAVGKIDGGVCVSHTLVAVCTGFGCTDPLIEVSTRRLIFDCDHGDVTEASRQLAREHAQSHAETCRAMPRPTA